MGETIQILQTLHKGSVDLNHTGGTGLTGRLDRHRLQGFEGALDNTYRMINDFHISLPRVKPIGRATKESTSLFLFHNPAPDPFGCYSSVNFHSLPD
jgi:hypothetical protein